MPISRILVVDDDPDMREMMTQFLRQNAMIALPASNESEIQKHLNSGRIDLIFLDVMLGDENGIEICNRLRHKHNVPIIMVSTLSADHQRMAGYEVGADDYIAKPFNPQLLLARAKAVLSRTNRASSIAHRRNTKSFEFGGWTYNAKRNEVLSPEGVQVALSRREIALLQALLANPHIPITRDEIIDLLDVTGDTKTVQGKDEQENEGIAKEALGRSVDMLVGRLRSKIEQNPKEPKILLTQRGVGYVFAIDVVEHEG
ncbi:MAG: response regulator [Nitratireductor sp.]